MARTLGLLQELKEGGYKQLSGKTAAAAASMMQKAKPAKAPSLRQTAMREAMAKEMEKAMKAEMRPLKKRRMLDME